MLKQALLMLTLFCWISNSQSAAQRHSLPPLKGPTATLHPSIKLITAWYSSPEIAAARQKYYRDNLRASNPFLLETKYSRPSLDQRAIAEWERAELAHYQATLRLLDDPDKLRTATLNYQLWMMRFKAKHTKSCVGLRQVLQDDTTAMHNFVNMRNTKLVEFYNIAFGKIKSSNK